MNEVDELTAPIRLPAIILLSGTPLDRKTSFTRQLVLLAHTLRGYGVEAFAVGYASEYPGTVSVFGAGGEVILETASNSGLLQALGAGACVLLGYPDQLQALPEAGRSSIPLFLWAQYSRPPRPEDLAGLIPVPLTKRTGDYLHSSGLSGFPDPIPHGVDTTHFYPLADDERDRIRSSRGLGRRFVVGTVAAHMARKRFDLVLESFARMLAHKRNAFLIIKTDRLLSHEGFDLISRAKALGVLHSVRIVTGELTERGMRELYGQMDVYLNLSEWEGFCIPVIEAMACGVPVACQLIQGPGEIVPYKEFLIGGSDIVKDGESVLLQADPGRAAAVLLEAAALPGLLERLGDEGITAVKECYDIKRVARTWIKIIEGALRVQK